MVGDLLAAKVNSAEDAFWYVLFFVVVIGLVSLERSWTAKKKAEKTGKHWSEDESYMRFRNRLLEQGTRTQAMVVFHSHKEGYYYPKVKYQLPDGRELKHQSSRNWPQPWPPVGTRVELAYDPEHPETATVVAWPEEKSGGGGGGEKSSGDRAA